MLKRLVTYREHPTILARSADEPGNKYGTPCSIFNFIHCFEILLYYCNSVVLLVVAATPATQAAAYKEGDNIGENKCPKKRQALR